MKARWLAPLLLVAVVVALAAPPTPAPRAAAGPRRSQPRRPGGAPAARPTAAARPAGVVYLTFDDGPTPAYTPRVLALLARHRARATFFVVGRNAATWPGLVRRELAAGHGVGNHTWSHRRLTGLRGGRLQAEVGSALSARGLRFSALCRG